MTEQIAYLEAVVGADITDFRRGMQDVRRETGLLSDTLGGLGAIGRGMTFAITAPLLAIGTAAVKVASDFDASMRNINSLAQLSQGEFENLSQKVLEFGAATRSGPQAAADALYEVYSAGVQGAAAFEIMRQSVMLSESGLSDLTKTTNALTATMLVYGDTAITTADASNIWARMVQQGVGSLGDFLTNAQKMLPLAHTLGISFQDLGANAAFLSQIGGGAAKAETSLAMMMSNLLKPTNTLQDEFDKLGVVTGIDLIKKFGSLEGAVKALRDDMSDQDFFKSFSKTGLEAALGLTNNYERLTGSIAAFNAGLDTATASAWDQQMLSFASTTDHLTSALTGAGIAVGTIIMPLIAPLMQGLTGVFLNIVKLPPEIIGMGVAFAGLLAAAGPVLWLLGALVSPIAVLIGLAGALAVGFATNFGGIRDTITSMVTTVLGPLDDLKKGVKDFFTTLFGDAPEGESGSGGATSSVGVPVTFELLPAYDPKFQSIYDLAKTNGVTVDDILKALGVNSLTEALGATPGTYTLTPAIELTPSIDYTQPVGEDWTATFLSENQDNSFGGRLSRAIENSWPAIQTSLSTMWDNVKNWFTNDAIPGLDTLGANVMATIGGWFTTSSTANSNAGGVFSFIRGLFNDAPKAVDSLTGTFPEMQTALGNLADSIGKWLSTSAIPTLARTFGYIFGTMAVGVGELIGQFWNLIKPGGSGEQAASSGANGLADSVLTPFKTGFEDALGDNDVKSGIDSFATGLAGILVEAFGIATLGQMLMGKGLLSALWGSIQFAIGGGGAAGAAGGAVSAEATAAATGIGSQIIGALTTFLLSPITLGVTLGLYIGNLPGVQDWVRGAFDTIFGKDAAEKGGQAFEQLVNTVINDLNGHDPKPVETTLALQPVMQMIDGAGVVVTDPDTWIENTVQNLFSQANSITLGGSTITLANGVTVLLPVKPEAVLPDGTRFSDPSGLTDYLLGQMQPTDTVATPGLGGGEGATSVAGSIALSFVNSLNTALTAEVANQAPNLTAAATNVTQPFTDTFLPYFSPTGPIMTKVNQFSATLSATFANLGKTLPSLVSPIVSSLDRVADAAWNIARGAAEAAGNLGNIAAPSTSGTGNGQGLGVDHNASGGTAKGWSVVGERGPELAYFGNQGTVMPTHMLRDNLGGGNSGGGDIVTMIIEGVTTFDDWISEARRRGYDVEKLRK